MVIYLKDLFVGQKTYEHYFWGRLCTGSQENLRFVEMMSGVKRLWSKLRASENTLSLIFNYREIDQNSGNSPNVSIPKIPIDKILLYHA